MEAAKEDGKGVLDRVEVEEDADGEGVPDREEEVMTTMPLQMILNMFHNVEFIFINIYNYQYYFL